MKKSLKIILFCLLVSLSLFLCSCKGDVKIGLQKSGAVSFHLTGDVGNVFMDLLSSNGSGSDIIDAERLKTELVTSGFSNVKVISKNGHIDISFLDEARDTYLFSSGLLRVSGSELSVSITPSKFLEFYNSCGEDIQMLLDLFLSPVLNDEIMDEEEYVDTIKVTYGEETGKEIDNSVVSFTVTDKNGNNKKRSIFLKSILCGEKFHF